VSRGAHHPVFVSLLVGVLLVAAGARAEEVADDDGLRLEPAAVPTATYNSDEGFGTGGVGTLYFHKDGVLPYKAALTLNIFISTRLVQAHRIRFETLRLFDLPLRALGQVGYWSTVTQNFCGYGNAVTCGADQARASAGAAGIPPDSPALAAVLRKHHQMRFVRLWGEGLARYGLRDKPHRIELWGGWRGNYFVPGEVRLLGIGDGQWFTPGPYPVSRWGEHFPEGEPGFSSVLQAGVAVDDRDEETQPNSGYFLEASARGAAPFTGSAWTWAGGNLTGAIYAPLVRGDATDGADLVLAARFIADVIVGDPSTEDLARLGGLTDYIAFGGSDVGRGIREHRYGAASPWPSWAAWAAACGCCGIETSPCVSTWASPPTKRGSRASTSVWAIPSDAMRDTQVRWTRGSCSGRRQSGGCGAKCRGDPIAWRGPLATKGG
jgi:hypothetical protein